MVNRLLVVNNEEVCDKPIPGDILIDTYYSYPSSVHLVSHSRIALVKGPPARGALPSFRSNGTYSESVQMDSSKTGMLIDIMIRFELIPRPGGVTELAIKSMMILRVCRHACICASAPFYR